jgi:hypothetical protein
MSFECEPHGEAQRSMKHKVYYKGEGGGLPQVWAVVSLVNLMNPSLLVVHPSTNYALTTLHLDLCRFM